MKLERFAKLVEAITASSVAMAAICVVGFALFVVYKFAV
jgi:hypothetical protein